MNRSDALVGASEPSDEAQQWLRAIPAAVYVTDAGWWLGEVRFVADAVADLGGRSATDYLDHPQRWLTAIGETSRLQALERLQAALDAGDTQVTLTYTLSHVDGSSSRIADTLNIQRDAEGQVVALVGVLERVATAGAGDAASRALLEHNPDLLLVLDADLACRAAAGAAARVLGASAEALVGRSLFELMAPEDAPRVQRALDEQAVTAGAVLLELRLRHRDGNYRWCEIHFAADCDAVCSVSPGWVAVARDITERRRQALQWDAYDATDELTSALNERAFLGLLRQAVAMGDVHGRLSLIVFEVDGFSDIVTRWGREGGDLVLACIGEMCRATLRERFSFGRLDARGFALLLSGKSLQETSAIAERLRARFGTTRVEFHGHWLAFSVSLGVAERRQGEPPERFLARAHSGLEVAMTHGGNRVQQAP
ncbi:PAS domain-containing protein [Salinicola sp. RZ23]|uniref:sensor domain-containing diguanylate cyclase n=1 Tax=Salinicola sp. RZ23 TaxID=1949087 RepID=UPI000DA25956|nr:PAS domain-containing protein [Salinicola sp. RZ23]